MTPIRVAYADPVYLGCARFYSVPGTPEFHPEAAKWDDPPSRSRAVGGSPTADEAEHLASVRRRVGTLMGIAVRFTTGPEVHQRYADLMAEKAAREVA